MASIAGSRVLEGASVAGTAVVTASVVDTAVSEDELDELSPPHADSEIVATRPARRNEWRLDMAMILAWGPRDLEVGINRTRGGGI